MPARALLLGDVNLTPDTQEHAALRDGDDGLVDAWLAFGNPEGPGWTSHEDRGGERIDYAFVTPELTDRLRAMSVDHGAQGSDHQPIRIEIDLLGAGTRFLGSPHPGAGPIWSAAVR